jgi:hypothetical protein
VTGSPDSLFFSAFSVPSVVKGFSVSVGKEKTFNTESTEKSRTNHESRITDAMGRTVPTFRQLIDDAIARWSKFRRALRREDQEYFDRLFRRVRSYTQAATYQASDNPMEAILLSIALDQEKRLDALERAAPRQAEAALPLETGAGSTLALNASGEAWIPPREGLEKSEAPEPLALHQQPVAELPEFEDDTTE